MNKTELTSILKGQLIVSCQADDGDPLDDPYILTAMAKTAVNNGARAIRACYPRNINAMRQELSVPIIGLHKKIYPDSPVFITPTLVEALKVAGTGCEAIALDATKRSRPGGEKLAHIVSEVRRNSKTALMADVSTLEEGLAAADLGFEIVASTLSGYTEETEENSADSPDFALVEALARRIGDNAFIIAEGKVWSPADAVRLLQCGADAVVVGSAITRPGYITKRYVEAMGGLA
ncbi:N-acetylmannosamine-6-phosphate 2-epimerase [candidate division KSB1 bacterium]|nr:N-acetylmannosamine-6-phosphate 2-epimerase [candidate division KSB1 bacterium]